MDWARRVELVSVLVASLVAVGGLWYTSVQTRLTAEEARADRTLSKSGQVTDRYTKAVENLAHEKEEVRLGSIYALQRIMEDSPRDQPTIASVLAAYLRTHADKRPAKGASSPADIQAAFAVLASRDTRHDDGLRLDLRDIWIVNYQEGRGLHGPGMFSAVKMKIDLSWADLTGAHLVGLNLLHARLRETTLAGSELTNTRLFEADLHGADLYAASMRGTSLHNADLRNAQLVAADLRETSWDGADLRTAHMDQTDLRGADFGDADLRGASLSEADLRKANLGSVRLSAKQRKDAIGG